MARWVERQGLTFRLDEEPTGHVRLSLLERRGLWAGCFNVREARTVGSSPAQAAGRRLSWRWLSRSEAEVLLEERCRTLQALGYRLVDSAAVTRGPWDWLHDLVRRELTGHSDDERPTPALHDALVDLGHDYEDLVAGIAEVLEIHPARMAHPDPDTIAAIDPRTLAIVLPFLLEHPDPQVRAVGTRWIESPTTLYELPPTVLEQWLRGDDRAAHQVRARLPDEGLALLGPGPILRLARGDAPEATRAAAAAWARRLG